MRNPASNLSLIHIYMAPDLVHLTGWVEIMGARLIIHTADRARNPDGSVNYTRLELM